MSTLVGLSLLLIFGGLLLSLGGTAWFFLRLRGAIQRSCDDTGNPITGQSPPLYSAPCPVCMETHDPKPCPRMMQEGSPTYGTIPCHGCCNFRNPGERCPWLGCRSHLPPPHSTAIRGTDGRARQRLGLALLLALSGVAAAPVQAACLHGQEDRDQQVDAAPVGSPWEPLPAYPEHGPDHRAPASWPWWGALLPLVLVIGAGYARLRWGGGVLRVRGQMIAVLPWRTLPGAIWAALFQPGEWFIGRHHLAGYMRRWLFRCPWFGVRLHHILNSDDDRNLHDHPWNFTSFLLTGGYTEVVPSDIPDCDGLHLWHPRFSVVRKRAEDLHRLMLDKPVWTLVFTGPKRRSWGFQTEKGWIPWRTYLRVLTVLLLLSGPAWAGQPVANSGGEPDVGQPLPADGSAEFWQLAYIGCQGAWNHICDDPPTLAKRCEASVATLRQESTPTPRWPWALGAFFAGALLWLPLGVWLLLRWLAPGSIWAPSRKRGEWWIVVENDEGDVECTESRRWWWQPLREAWRLSRGQGVQ